MTRKQIKEMEDILFKYFNLKTKIELAVNDNELLLGYHFDDNCNEVYLWIQGVGVFFQTSKPRQLKQFLKLLFDY